MSSYATANNEKLINTYTDNNQFNEDITVLANGGYVITWQSTGQVSDDQVGVFHQVFDADGKALGAPFNSNFQVTAGWQFQSTVTALPDGSFIVAFLSPDAMKVADDLYFQRFYANGKPAPELVPLNAILDGDQSEVEIAALADGGFIATWTSEGANGLDIYQRRILPGDIGLGNEKQVNTVAANNQQDAHIAVLSDGGWVIAFTSSDQDGFGIFQRRFDKDGLPVDNADVRVNIVTLDNQYDCAITSTSQGGWIVSWTSFSQDGSGNNIRFQRYDSDGVAIGTETRVNTTIVGEQTHPDIASLADDGFVIVWQGIAADGSYDIFQQRYDQDGKAVGQETRVNNTTVNDQTNPHVIAFADGSWEVTWDSKNQAGPSSGTDVYSRRFAVERLGTTGDDTLVGTHFDERIVGKAGNDILDGNGGNDVLVGGTGNDVYVVNYGDTIQEKVNEGIDTVKSASTWSIEENLTLENITLTGAAIDATGNELANVLVGNSNANHLTGDAGDDRLDGGKGNDFLYGGEGSDTYVIDSSKDLVSEEGSTGTDTVEAYASFVLPADVENIRLMGTGNISATGNSAANILTGNKGNNILNGAGGADRMTGGAGNDTFVVDNKADQVQELANGGIDTVRTGLVSYTLGVQLENLVLTGSGNQNGKGNAHANRIYGNGLKNTLDGLDGNDNLYGGSGDDLLRGGNGHDHQYGGAGNDRITGEAGRDILKGDAGRDQLWGGRDNDRLYGGTQNDILHGDAGKDFLSGDAGDDVLYGGTEKDIFAFNGRFGKDHIMDFRHGQDKIDVHSIKQITSFKDLVHHHMTEKGNTVTIHVGGNSITVEHTHIKDFHAGDFMI